MGETLEMLQFPEGKEQGKGDTFRLASNLEFGIARKTLSNQ